MEDSYSTKDLAEKFNVPWQTVAAWKRYDKIPQEAFTADGRFLKSVIDPLLESGDLVGTEAPAPVQKSVARVGTKPLTPSSFDDFARAYWQEGTKAVDVLLMPSETSALLVNHVNDALRYAWDTLR